MKFNDIFSSGAVFAKGKPIRIYGSGVGIAELTFAGAKKSVVSKDGSWSVEFPAMECGGPYSITLKSDEKQTVLDDIYVGEVYLFAGQSNMQFKVREGKDDPHLCESNEMLRLYSPDRIEKGDFYTPQDGWVKADRSMAQQWSALAHYTGLQLQKEKNVAIGIVVCYQGASIIESWVPKGIFEQNGISVPQEEKSYSHHNPDYSAWNRDGVLYEHMMKQVIPFSLNGVVWYQGESDSTVSEANVYCKELEILVDAWRHDFGDSKLPFVIVQIANYDDRDDDGWHLIQKAQYDVQLTVPNVKTVISSDVSESVNIHPSKKYELSKRIFNALLNS